VLSEMSRDVVGSCGSARAQRIDVGIEGPTRDLKKRRTVNRRRLTNLARKRQPHHYTL
jgi:hypothetical protein